MKKISTKILKSLSFILVDICHKSLFLEINEKTEMANNFFFFLLIEMANICFSFFSIINILETLLILKQLIGKDVGAHILGTTG